MVLTQKVALITGAGSGIGQALAQKLEKEGCLLALSDLTIDALTETQGLLLHPEKHHYYSLDVADWAAWQNYIVQVISTFGHLDIAINNAGVALGSFSAEEVSIENFKWLMDINFWGMVYGTKVCLPYLKKQNEACIANVSSILGLAAVSNQAPYCASKFGIRGFTESLRMEALINFPHVNVLSIHPGGIKTNIAKNSNWTGMDIDEHGKELMRKEFEKTFINTPLYAACEIVYAIKNDKKRLLIGRDARSIWRIVWFFPVKYTNILYHNFIKKLEVVHKSIQQSSTP